MDFVAGKNDRNISLSMTTTEASLYPSWDVPQLKLPTVHIWLSRSSILGPAAKVIWNQRANILGLFPKAFWLIHIKGVTGNLPPETVFYFAKCFQSHRGAWDITDDPLFYLLNKIITIKEVLSLQHYLLHFNFISKSQVSIEYLLFTSE